MAYDLSKLIEAATRDAEMYAQPPRSEQDLAEVDARLEALRDLATSRDRQRYEAVAAALERLIVDANRLCDRNQGGSYEADCRQSIRAARAVLASARGELWPAVLTDGNDNPVRGA